MIALATEHQTSLGDQDIQELEKIEQRIRRYVKE
jgi:hypothetical protein